MAWPGMLNLSMLGLVNMFVGAYKYIIKNILKRKEERKEEEGFLTNLILSNPDSKMYYSCY